jgi:hypothetical protein
MTSRGADVVNTAELEQDMRKEVLVSGSEPLSLVPYIHTNNHTYVCTYISIYLSTLFFFRQVTELG